MAEVKTEATVPAPIQSKFNIALTETGFQKMADRASKLVFNEDNVEEIKSFLTDVRKVEKAIEDTHKKGKEPSLKEGQQWDAAKKTFLAQAAAIKSTPQQKYETLCREIENKRIAQEKEKLRVDTIKNGIEGNAVAYANKIANCTTTKELTAVESLINLEKTRKDKYAEFLPEAIERFSELNAILKDQKKKVADLEALHEQELKAQESGDEEALISIAEKKEEVSQSIDESKIAVQEKAAEQAMGSDIEVATVAFPKVSARRSTWKWEVKDINVTQKKMPSFVKLVIDEDAVDRYLAAKKTEGIEGDFEVFGIRFYLHKTY